MAASSRTVSLPWGPHDTRDLELPPGWRVIAELGPRLPDIIPELGPELERALQHPIGLPRLSEFARPGKSACIVVDDRTRPTPVAAMLAGVIAELGRAGVPDDGITILIGAGTHRAMTESEVRARVGPEVLARYPVANHRMLEAGELVAVGRTATDGIPVSFNRRVVEAATVVLVGCIEAHEIAGFGGGYKNLMPGCSGPSSVAVTHHPRFQAPERISHSGLPRERCRFRRVIDECGSLLGPKVFIVNAVMEGTRVMAVVAGDPLAAHAAGAEIYRDMASVRLERPGDVVIAGARPLDLDLRVSMKACFNASAALKPGGVFIMASAAPEGLGDLRAPRGLPAGAKWFFKKFPERLIEPVAMRVNKSPDQAVGTMSVVKILKTAAAWLYLTPEFEGADALGAMGIEFFSDREALMARARALRPEAEVVVLPQAGASFVAWD